MKSFLLLTLVCLSLRLDAVNYYVKTNGSNSNNGTSYSTAFKTIQKALSVASPGSVIFVAGGTYKERLVWSNSGSASGGFIKLTNYNSGIVYVDGGAGGTNNTANELLAINGKSYVKIENIRFKNNYRAFASGIYVTGAGRDIQILNCQIFNMGWTNNASAVPTSGDNANPLVVVGNQSDSLRNILISGNLVKDCITGYSEAVALNGNVTNFTIENNTVNDNKNIGIVCAGHYSWTGAPASVNQARNGVIRLNTVYNCVSPVATSAGIYVDGGKNIIIERNKSYLNGCGISVGCENEDKTSSNTIVRNNWVYNNVEAGIYLGSNAANSQVTNSSVTNNTFFKNYSTGGWGAEVVLQNGTGNSFKQNILVPRTNTCVAFGIWGFTQTNLVLSYNLLWRTTGYYSDYYANVSPDPNAVLGNPKFSSTSSTTAPNLHLLTGSSAINKGNPNFTAATGELDIDGQVRVQQGKVDIGADETNLSSFNFSGNNLLKPDVSHAADELYVSPNPAIHQASISLGSSEEEAAISILDFSGHIIKQFSTSGTGNIEFDVSDWEAGIYLIVCRRENGSIQRSKFVVGN